MVRPPSDDAGRPAVPDARPASAETRSLRPDAAVSEATVSADEAGGGAPRVLYGAPSGSWASREVSALLGRGLAVLGVHDVADLVQLAGRWTPDLVVLHVALLPGDPLDAVARVRTRAGCSTIVVGPLPGSSARAALLRAGADDCVPWPYVVEELVARIEVALRHSGPAPAPAPDPEPTLLSGGPITMDLGRRTAHVHDREVSLTVLEFALLRCLLRNAGAAVSRERLLADVWGYTVGSTDTVTVHVRRLRAKIEPDPSRPRWVQTVWGYGYRFGPPAGPSAGVPRGTRSRSRHGSAAAEGTAGTVSRRSR